MSQSAIQAAIQQICQEKNLSEESVLTTIELALAAAFRKDFGNKLQNIVTEFDIKAGLVKVFDVKTVVEDLPEDYEEQLLAEKAKREEAGLVEEDVQAFVSEDDEVEEGFRKFNPKTEIQLKDAKELDKKYQIGDIIKTELEVPGEFGRMAAQTAKQVIIQKLREQERQNIFEEFKTMEGQVVNGTIQRREGRNVLVDLGRAVAVMPPEEQIERERYNIGNRMKFYLKIVDQTTRGPQLLVSRVSEEIVRRIFESEVPEIATGAIEIKSIAREPGNRSKVAIASNDESIDPVGSCVGQRGSRIQTIISELNGEKIDIILWDENPIQFITNALSPAKVVSVALKESEEEKLAIVTVKDDQLSLAIGRGGQNVRLASRLTGWKLDIISVNSQNADESVETDQLAESAVEAGEAESPVADEEVKSAGDAADNEELIEKPKKATIKKTAKKAKKKAE
ncbi:MAG TPA: transcription termination factor NusA [bacterium]|nr:transcription termination factor NusA [bacterium]